MVGGTSTSGDGRRPTARQPAKRKEDNIIQDIIPVPCIQPTDFSSQDIKSNATSETDYNRHLRVNNTEASAQREIN